MHYLANVLYLNLILRGELALSKLPDKLERLFINFGYICTSN
jgi:hypothetical protein